MFDSIEEADESAFEAMSAFAAGRFDQYLREVQERIRKRLDEAYPSDGVVEESPDDGEHRPRL